jgi:hypothetical protein
LLSVIGSTIIMCSAMYVVVSGHLHVIGWKLIMFIPPLAVGKAEVVEAAHHKVVEMILRAWNQFNPRFRAFFLLVLILFIITSYAVGIAPLHGRDPGWWINYCNYRATDAKSIVIAISPCIGILCITWTVIYIPYIYPHFRDIGVGPRVGTTQSRFLFVA